MGCDYKKLHGPFGQAGMECALWPAWGDKVVGRALEGKKEGQGTLRTIYGQRWQEVEPQGLDILWSSILHLMKSYTLREAVDCSGHSVALDLNPGSRSSL